MAEELLVTGMVLFSASFGEYDRRVVLLTRERGKITVFANGARKPSSRLRAATNVFSFGTFAVYDNKSGYKLVRAEISNPFREVMEDFEGVCYGSYFMEIADYYSRENLDGSDLLNLLYASLRALTNPKLNKELVRSIFEMKAMVLDGEYPYETAEDPALQESTRYALAYVIQAPIRRLYTFTLKPEIQQEFSMVQRRMMKRIIGREFKSLAVINSLLFTPQ